MYKLSFIVLLFTVKILFAQLPHGANFNFECQICHKTDTWKITGKISFDHTQTGFELQGQHRILDCKSCHKTLEFANVSKHCFNCHTDIHNNTVSKSCENCHSTRSWVIENINDIHRMSRFPLVGAHRLADCIECHKSFNNLQFEQLGVECMDCHINNYQATRSPNHKQAGFSTDCQECHLVSDHHWSKGTFNHSFFPLVGGHKISNCFNCHTSKSFSGLTSDCFSCHNKDYNSSTNPNHKELNFSTDCLTCHTTAPGWKPAEFKQHDNLYPLIGAHKIISGECYKCHITGYKNTPDDCFGCHQKDYINTTNPNHKSANFSTDCETCHNNNAWKPATFDHDGQYFPIYSGKHNNKWSKCSDCHTSTTNYQIFECINCHEHRKSKMDEEHGGINGYVYQSTACLACHPSGNKEGNFDHATTQFPLTGKHVNVDCKMCHTNGYSGTSNKCLDCHIQKYNNSVTPNHTKAGISTQCENCHTTNGWKPSTFNHSTTGFELAGGHNLPDCSSCHSGSTSNASSDCYSCHSSNYASAPEHTAQNYPKDCQQCHNTTDWKQVTFNHDNTQFPLTGSHKSVDCSACHTSGYAGIPTECVSCHKTDYNNTSNPNHSASGFSTQCEDCHTTKGWTPSTFDHDGQYFPIYSGKHRGKWNNCNDCHTNQNNYSQFSCLTCHEHSRTKTDDKHKEVNGYSYNSSACLSCHPTGRE